MVVPKEIGAEQSEILVFILHGARERDLALENHIELAEVLASFDDGLVGNEHSAVQRTDKPADELVAALQPLTDLRLVIE